MDTYEANIRVRDMPRAADRILSTLAGIRGVTKWEIIRDALVEFAEKHKHEIAEMAKT